MTGATVAFNAVMLAADAALLANARGRSSRSPAPLLIVAWIVAGLIVAASLAVDGFDGARLAGWLWFAHAPLVAAGTAWFARGRQALIALTLTVALAGTSAYAYLIEPRWLEVSRVQIVDARVQQRLRVGLVADLQTDMVGEHEVGALRALMRERPDVIVFAGDYTQAPRGLQGPTRKAISRALASTGVSAPHGVFAVAGNVDEPGWEEIFAEGAYQASSETRTITSGPVSVTTLSVRDSFDTSLRVGRAPGFHIVAGHSPDYALGDIDAGLLLAGHTHGGQFRIPGVGPVVNNSELPRSWASGVTQIRPGTTLVVSRGVGMERGNAPRLRFLSRPEVTVIDIVPS